MRRRDFIKGIAGSATAWPFLARAQPTERKRRIAVLVNRAESDPDGQARVAAFHEALQKLGWNDSNVQIDTRWGADDVERERSGAVELLALAPDVIFPAVL
jgi:putative ABC transport system substrate-binding protein